jgi:hypothetical protein
LFGSKLWRVSGCVRIIILIMLTLFSLLASLSSSESCITELPNGRALLQMVVDKQHDDNCVLLCLRVSQLVTRNTLSTRNARIILDGSCG